MKIAVAKERRKGEKRVAASPDSVKKLVALGAEVVVEKGAGVSASIRDSDYEAAGARIADDYAAAVAEADVVAKVQRPLRPGEGEVDEITPLRRGALLVGMLAPYADAEGLAAYAGQGVTAVSLELLPRITRAQGMDVLSSQSNLAGYKAVIDAAEAYDRAFPMMMTAAGTIPPARVVVLGAGVAGLQAIATARRLGAIVSAFDVRAAAKEQVHSLGASFVEVPGAADGEAKGGYAKEMDEEYRKRQAQVLHDHLKKQDIAICTALIPGRPAPRLITEAMLKDMKPGSVIVDLAVETGGNCEFSQKDKTVSRHGVTILGHSNTPSRIAADASQLYARNVLAYLSPLVDKDSKSLKIGWDDEIVAATVLTRDGQVVHERFREAPPAAPPAPAPEAAPKTEGEG